MKVLCPVEFSNSCVNAVHYATRLCESMSGGSIQLLHCSYVQSRAMVFVDVSEMFKQQALSDMQQLVKEMDYDPQLVSFSFKVSNADPKRFIIPYAEQREFDYIVVGTKGLTALKEYIIGSVTETLFNHSGVPVFAVPPSYKNKKGIKRVVFAIDGSVPKAVLDKVCPIVKANKAKLNFVHVKNESKGRPPISEWDCELDVRPDFTIIPMAQSVVDSIGRYCKVTKADLLVMLKKKRGWFYRLLHKSNTKTKLYQLKRPLLVIPTGTL